MRCPTPGSRRSTRWPPATATIRRWDALLLRFHTETACRRGGALNLRRVDLDQRHCLVRLREKGGTERWQPTSPTLMHHLLAHWDDRGDGDPRSTGQLLRYRNRRR